MAENCIYKFFDKKGLVFVLLGDTQYGYRAFEGRYSIVAAGDSRSHLIEEIKNQVNKRFDGKFDGKIVLRGFVDEEIAI